MINKIRKHLQENDMTYWQHLKFAASYGFACVVAGILLIFHSILPCFFQSSGRDLLRTLEVVFDRDKL
jgi:hypothetical protein